MTKMQELYAKVAGDAALQEQFNLILREAEKAGQAGQAVAEEKLLAFAKEAGSAVSLEEMGDFFLKQAEQTAWELSDAQMDQVAGGKGEPTPPPEIPNSILPVATEMCLN